MVDVLAVFADAVEYGVSAGEGGEDGFGDEAGADGVGVSAVGEAAKGTWDDGVKGDQASIIVEGRVESSRKQSPSRRTGIQGDEYAES